MFDFDGKVERSDFQNLFGLGIGQGEGRAALLVGARAAGASLLGVQPQAAEPRFRDTGADDNGPAEWLPWGVAGLALLGLVLAANRR